MIDWFIGWGFLILIALTLAFVGWLAYLGVSA